MMSGSLLSTEENEEFYRAYDDIIKGLVSLHDNSFGRGMDQERKWMKAVLDYNVFTKGHHLRGSIVPLAYKAILSTGPTAGKDDLRLSCVLGWVVENYHGSNAITANMMDEKNYMEYHHRQLSMPQLSWHQLKNVDVAAINDGFMLKMANHNILKIFLGSHPSHFRFEEAVRDSNNRCLCGRMLHEQMKKLKNITESYTMQRYRQVVKNEKSYYSFYMPIAFALALAGKSDDKELIKILKVIMMEIGYYFQLRVDYSEIFGDVDLKSMNENLDMLNWLFVRALEILRDEEGGSSERIKVLIECVQDNNLEKVRKIYGELGIFQEYQIERKKSYLRILKYIQDYSDILKNKMDEDFFLKVIQNM